MCVLRHSLPRFLCQSRKHVIRIIERRRAEPAAPPPAAAAGAVAGPFVSNSLFEPHHDSEEVESPGALSIRMGFTGAFFKDEDGKLRQDLFCCLFVTPLRNFDMHSYIVESFLAKPRPGCQDFKAKHDEWAELSFIWNLLLQYEAYENLQINPQARPSLLSSLFMLYSTSKHDATHTHS